MKRKRFDRDVWWAHNKFNNTEYYQMRIDMDDYHGLVCYIKMLDGKYHYWDMPIAGKTAIIGEGMFWLQLVPDNNKHVITAKYLSSNKLSLCYIDVIEAIEYDSDGVAVFIDKYLDVTFTPQGDLIIADRDELDDAYQSNIISKEQYDSALIECDLIINELCSNITKTEAWCDKILSCVNNRINNGEKQFTRTY